MYSFDLAGFRICQEFRLITDPVDVHLFTRDAFDSHLSIAGTIGSFYETVVVFVEL